MLVGSAAAASGFRFRGFLRFQLPLTLRGCRLAAGGFVVVDRHVCRARCDHGAARHAGYGGGNCGCVASLCHSVSGAENRLAALVAGGGPLGRVRAGSGQTKNPAATVPAAPGVRSRVKKKSICTSASLIVFALPTASWGRSTGQTAAPIKSWRVHQAPRGAPHFGYAAPCGGGRRYAAVAGARRAADEARCLHVWWRL